MSNKIKIRFGNIKPDMSVNVYIKSNHKALPDVLALASFEARLNIISQTLTLKRKNKQNNKQSGFV